LPLDPDSEHNAIESLMVSTTP